MTERLRVDSLVAAVPASVKQVLSSLTSRRCPVTSLQVHTPDSGTYQVVGILAYVPRDSLRQLRIHRSAQFYVDAGCPRHADVVSLDLPEWVPEPVSAAELATGEMAEFGAGCVIARAGLVRVRVFRRVLRHESPEQGVAALVDMINRHLPHA